MAEDDRDEKAPQEAREQDGEETDGPAPPFASGWRWPLVILVVIVIVVGALGSLGIAPEPPPPPPPPAPAPPPPPPPAVILPGG